MCKKWIRDNLIQHPFIGSILFILLAILISFIIYSTNFETHIGYNISVDIKDKKISMSPGDLIQAAVIVRKNSNYDQPVSLTANNLPKNVEVSFLSQSGIIPTYSSIMKVTVSPNATEVDNWTIWIRGIGANEKGNGMSDNFNLTIKKINNTNEK